MPRPVTEAQKSHLVSLNKRPKEEARRIQSMGGKASAIANRKKKAFREAVAAFLAAPAMWKGKQLVDPVTGEALDDMQAALIVRTMQEAMGGNVKAAKLIAEWLGEGNTPAGVNINVSLGK